MENNESNIKPWKEQFAAFLDSPTRGNFRNLLQLEDVEDDDLDFKKELLPFDALAKHMLAMANTRGDAIVFGVEEEKPNQFSPSGLTESIDITDIRKGLDKYIPRKMNYESLPQYFGEDEDVKFKGKIFLIILVAYDPKYLPLIALKSGDQIRNNAIYIRRNAASEPANYDELQEILSKRIDTVYSATEERKLVEHLEELKELYRHIPKTVKKLVSYSPPKYMQTFAPSLKDVLGHSEYEEHPNPDYPDERYEEFIRELISIKKKTIVEFVRGRK